MTEYFDILTVYRYPTGKVRPRGEALQEGEYRHGAEIFIFHEDGRLMITRRHLKKDGNPGRWECTAGLVTTGESTFNTILREAEEEIGLTLDPKKVRRLGTKLCGREYLDVFTTTTTAAIEDLKLQPTEVIDAKYVNRDELKAMLDSGEFVEGVYERIMCFRSLLRM